MFTPTWFRDAALRVLWTFVQAFSAGLVVLDVAGVKAAAAAGIAAALSAVKSIIATAYLSRKA